uniref:Glutaredoxin domain-containing protein n=1 Tax=Proboscia inermis TaxID=420281 RepID=A0A7S0C8J3_9STRA
MKLSLIIASAMVATTTAFAVVGNKSCASQLSKASGFGRNMSAPRSVSTSLSMSTPTEFVKTEIASAKVVIFSKPFCPFCKKTKKLLDSKSIEYKAIEITELDNGDEVQDALLEISGQRTVPNVFINGEHLGGNDVVQKSAKTGKLDELLA